MVWLSNGKSVPVVSVSMSVYHEPKFQCAIISVWQFPSQCQYIDYLASVRIYAGDSWHMVRHTYYQATL